MWAKGPWFDSHAAVSEWIANMPHPGTRTQLLSRIVEVWCKTATDEQAKAKYKVCKGGTRGGKRRELRSLPKPTGLVIRRTRRLKEVFLNIPMLQQHSAAVRVELLSTPPVRASRTSTPPVIQTP